MLPLATNESDHHFACSCDRASSCSIDVAFHASKASVLLEELMGRLLGGPGGGGGRFEGRVAIRNQGAFSA